MKKFTLFFCLFIFLTAQLTRAQLPSDTIGAGKALVFSGVDGSHVELGNPYPNLTFPFSFQAWINPASYADYLGGVFANNNDTEAYFGFTIRIFPPGQLDISFGDGVGLSYPNRRGFISSNSIPLNKWTQISIVCKSISNVQMYFNGVLQPISPDDGSSPITALTFSPGGHTNIGEQWNDYVYQPFNGSIDEVRLWDDSLSQTIIQANLCSKISSKTPGLLGYWRADEADTSKTVYDYTSNGANGKLVGTYSRSISDAPIGNSSNYLYTSNFTGQSVKCGASNGDTLIAGLITGAPDGVQIYAVNSHPYFTEGLSAVANNYFGVFCINGTTPAYQPTYHYALPDGFLNSGNVSSASLDTRTNATDTPWTFLYSLLNTSQQTLTPGGLGSPQEFIETLTGSFPCDTVNIVNNPGFENHRAWPLETNQLNLCDGWSNCNGNYGAQVCSSPDYLSTMGTGYAEIPDYIDAVVYPHSGDCVADFVTFHGVVTDYREYIRTYLTQPMVAGQTYTVSFYLTTGQDQLNLYNSNNVGVLFTKDSSFHNCLYVARPQLKPQINIASVIDTTGWKLFSYQFTADSAYNYITFGNFYPDSETTVSINSTGQNFDPYAQFFIDDISIYVSGGNINASISPAYDTICPGASVTIKAYGGTNYLWSTTATADSITVSPPNDTIYTVTITSGSCVGNDTSRITVNPAPPLRILPQPPPYICFTFQSDTLRVASQGSDFTWSPSLGLSATTGVSVIANPSVSVTYTVTGIDSLGCAARGAEPVTILPIVNKPSFFQHNDTLISSSKTDNQWYRNDTLLLNDTSQYLIISILGNYYVEINNEANGCSTSSDTVDITSLTGIEQLTVNSGQWTIYPNPTGGQINIVSTKTISTVTVTNLLGQVVLKSPSEYSTPPSHTNSNTNATGDLGVTQFTFELNDEGMYFVTVTADGETATRKVVVSK